MSTTVEIALPGISCINCVRPLQNVLTEQKTALNIKTFYIDIPNKILYINFDKPDTLSLTKLTDTIDEFGIKWSIDSEEEITAPAPSLWQKTSKFLLSHWISAFIGLFSGVGLLILSLSGLVLPFSAVIALTIAGTLMTAAIGAPSFYHAWQKFRAQRTLTMDTLFALSSLVIVSVSSAALFIPGLPMMIEAGLMIFGFRHLGQGIEENLIKKTNGRRRFQDRLPLRVNKVVDGNPFAVKLNTLNIGDTIQLAAGDIIPLDCELLSDEGIIFDTLKSGSILPRTVQKHQPLSSGFKISDDSPALTVRVTQTAANSYLAKMDEQLIRAQTEKAPIEKFTDKILQYFIPAVLLISTVCGVGLAIFFPAAIAIKCAAAVLVSACPCTLGLIVPMGVRVGIRKALEHGVEFKNSEAMEKASRINCIVFDLNGSLTQGTPKVTGFYSNDFTPPEFSKAITALLESHSTHPVAKALIKFCGAKHDAYPFNISSMKSNPGGVSAAIKYEDKTHSYHIGNEQYMKTLGIPLPKNQDRRFLGQQRIYLAQDKHIISAYTLIDPLREQAFATIRELQKENIEVHICTGADRKTAQGYARLLGIPETNIAANCVPVKDRSKAKTKSHYIQSLQKSGKIVAMVGDAGNDAPALVQSNFGIAIHSHASDSMTREKADALITRQNCLPVLHCFSIARQSMRNIKQNLYFSFAYNTLALLLTSGLLLAIGFSVNPALGAGLMVLQTSLILLNVYRFSQQKVPHSSLRRQKNASSQHLYELGIPHSLNKSLSPQPDNSNVCSVEKEEKRHLWKTSVQSPENSLEQEKFNPVISPAL